MKSDLRTRLGLAIPVIQGPFGGGLSYAGQGVPLLRHHRAADLILALAASTSSTTPS